MNHNLVKIFLATFSALILLSACSAPDSKQEGLIVMDESNTKVYPKMDMLVDLVDEWEVVPLESSAQALLHSANIIEADESLFFILSSPNAISPGTKQEIKVFDYSGNFLHNIGVFGRGPEEYSGISRWSLDRARKQVWIYNSSEVIKYGYDGKFVEKIEVDGKLGFLSIFKILPDENVLIFKGLEEESNVSHILTDHNFNIIDTLKTFGFSFSSDSPGMASMSLWTNDIVSINDNSVLLSRFLCDTLFRYSEKKLVPAYYIPLDLSLPKGFSLRSEYDFGNLIEELGAQGLDFFKNGFVRTVFETDTYSIFIKGKQSVWNKELMKGAIFGKEGNTMTIPIRLICADHNSLIGSIDAIRLVQYKEKCESEGVTLPVQLKELFDGGFNEENNSVLFRYKLKTKSELF